MLPLLNGRVGAVVGVIIGLLLLTTINFLTEKSIVKDIENYNFNSDSVTESRDFKVERWIP